jgi:hypothetical protein
MSLRLEKMAPEFELRSDTIEVVKLSALRGNAARCKRVHPRIHPVEAVRIISDNILERQHSGAFRGRTHREKGLRRGAQGGWKRGMERSEDLRRVAHGLRGQMRCRSDLHLQLCGFPAAGSC